MLLAKLKKNMPTEMEIVLSPKASRRLEEFAEYLYAQTQSKRFVTEYIGKIETHFEKILNLFPESGTPIPEYGEGIRRLTYQNSSILYKIEQNRIEILTFYRQNQP
jgi:plasmid stabilization system protein ParE